MTELNPQGGQVPAPAPAAPKEGGGVQDRINQLTKGKREVERANESLRAELAALTSQVATLTEHLAAPARPAERPAPRDPLADLLGGSKPQAQPADIQELVRNAVSDALRPLAEQQSQRQAAEQLHSAQLRSFQEAAALVPGIAQVGSAEQRLFDQIWEANPDLHAVPNAPALVINAVHGIMVEAQKDAKVTDGKKQAATSPPPASPSSRLQALPDQEQRNAAAYQELARTGSQRILDQSEVMAMIGLGLKRANVRE